MGVYRGRVVYRYLRGYGGSKDAILNRILVILLLVFACSQKPEPPIFEETVEGPEYTLNFRVYLVSDDPQDRFNVWWWYGITPTIDNPSDVEFWGYVWDDDWNVIDTFRAVHSADELPGDWFKTDPQLWDYDDIRWRRFTAGVK